jgi:hypothetical protein
LRPAQKQRDFYGESLITDTSSTAEARHIQTQLIGEGERLYT